MITINLIAVKRIEITYTDDNESKLAGDKNLFSSGTDQITTRILFFSNIKVVSFHWNYFEFFPLSGWHFCKIVIKSK